MAATPTHNAPSRGLPAIREAPTERLSSRPPRPPSPSDEGDDELIELELEAFESELEGLDDWEDEPAPSSESNRRRRSFFF